MFDFDKSHTKVSCTVMYNIKLIDINAFRVSWPG